MGADQIIARIREDAEAKAAAIRREGEEEADRILRDGEKAAMDEYQRILEHGRGECMEMAARIRSQARLDAKRMVRRAREKGIRRSFQDGEAAFGSLPETDRYPLILATLIEDGTGSMGEGEVHIISNERDRELIRGLLPELSETEVEVCLSHECAITSGGVILVSEDGRISVNNTFEARLERLRSDLVHRVSEILFGREEGA
ncbi:MAG: V-type ATP synthase subunit E family protein [Methanomicrobiaceae archaeon]|nr:V-type ATP synthase subunit E family protein [Methanomicrobiaceae archaeon]